jgi:hypothetical protein
MGIIRFVEKKNRREKNLPDPREGCLWKRERKRERRRAKNIGPQISSTFNAYTIC